MTLLALDTSARHRLLAVRGDAHGAVLDGVMVSDVMVSSSLPQVLERLLEDNVEAVVVATGPGAYTSLRTGMAYALGVAHARGLPLHGMGSLEVVATPFAPGPVRVVADAGRGGRYTAVYVGADVADQGLVVLEAPRRIAADVALPPEFRAVSFDSLEGENVEIVGEPLAALALAAVRARRRPPLDPAALTPDYLDGGGGRVDGSGPPGMMAR